MHLCILKFNCPMAGGTRYTLSITICSQLVVLPYTDSSQIQGLFQVMLTRHSQVRQLSHFHVALPIINRKHTAGWIEHLFQQQVEYSPFSLGSLLSPALILYMESYCTVPCPVQTGSSFVVLSFHSDLCKLSQPE